jgi:hypothetical protein
MINARTNDCNCITSCLMNGYGKMSTYLSDLQIISPFGGRLRGRICKIKSDKNVI